MKAIRINNGKAEVHEIPKPNGRGVRVKLASSSICGSDLHMMELGILQGRTPGHEFAGFTDNGTAVAIEPLYGCGGCFFCDDGQPAHCHHGAKYVGVMVDGGMAEYVEVPPQCLVELPSGLKAESACLVEPLAIALRGLQRVNPDRAAKRCLVIGGGPIGLAAAAAAQHYDLACDVLVRYDHQALAAQAIGANAYKDVVGLESYPIVFDAVGSSQSLQQASKLCQPMGKIGMLGTAWGETKLAQSLQSKEIDLIAATGYQCNGSARTFNLAAQLLLACPQFESAMITHRLPLDAGQEAFDLAADRSQGVIKVSFSF